MISREQRLPTAIACLALFVALGGTSYAAVKLKKDSVTTREIKDGTIATADLGAGVITSGPAGARGPRGADGPAGATGAQGVAKVYVTRRPGSVGAVTSRAVLATLRVPAGTYRLDFATGAYSLDPTTWLDCAIEADGRVIKNGAMTLGGDAPGSIEQWMSFFEVATFDFATTVTVACSQRSSAHQGLRAYNLSLMAMPVTSVEVQ